MLSFIFNFIFTLLAYTLMLRTLKGNVRNLRRHRIKDVRQPSRRLTHMPTEDTMGDITILPPDVPNFHYYEFIQNHLRRQQLITVKIFQGHRIHLNQYRNRRETLTNQRDILRVTYSTLVDFLLYRSHKPLIHIPGFGLYRLYAWTFNNGEYIHYVYQEDLELICIVFTRLKTPQKPLADVL